MEQQSAGSAEFRATSKASTLKASKGNDKVDLLNFQM